MNYGPIGLAILILIAAIIYLVIWLRHKDRDAKAEREATAKMHKEEREAFQKIVKEQFDESNEQNAENKTILTRLTVLLETLHREK